MTSMLILVGIAAVLCVAAFIWLAAAQWPVRVRDDGPSLVLAPPKTDYAIRWVPKQHLAPFVQVSEMGVELRDIERPVFFLHNAGRESATDVVATWTMTGEPLIGIVSKSEVLQQMRAILYEGGCAWQAPNEWVGAEDSFAGSCADVAESPRIPFIPQSQRLDDVVELPMPGEIHGATVVRLLAGPRPTDISRRIDGPVVRLSLASRNGEDLFEDVYAVSSVLFAVRDDVQTPGNLVDPIHRWNFNLRGTIRFSIERVTP